MKTTGARESQRPVVRVELGNAAPAPAAESTASADRYEPMAARGRFAVVDVGTWGAKLLVGDDRGLSVAMHSITTALGEGVQPGSAIPDENAKRAVQASLELARRAQALGVSSSDIDVIATACVRNSTNGDALMASIAAAIGTQRIRVIGGDEEARLAYAGVTSDLPRDAPAAIFEIGGGSFQIGRGVGPTLLESASQQIGVYGTNRLCEQHGHDPKRVAHQLAADYPVLRLSRPERDNLRAVGWDARYFAMRLGTSVLTSAALTRLRDDFAACDNSAQRMALLLEGLTAQQITELSLDDHSEVASYAAAVVGALTLFIHVLEGTGARTATVSDRDTRHAVIAEHLSASRE